MRDGLTGLYNRRELQRILKEAVGRYQRYNEPAAIILLDLDHFKSVNDTYGHHIGDSVLRRVSSLLLDLARTDDKVARYGGEELAVIMPRATIEIAAEAAEHLRSAVSARPFVFAQTTDDPYSKHGERTADGKLLVPITVSLGVAVLSSDVDSAHALIEGADRALYEAKRAGRNCTRIHRTLSPKLEAV